MQILSFHNLDIKPEIKQIAEFRLKYFKEYPYLYVGSLSSEHDYLEHFSESKNSLLTLAKVENTTIAIATSIALADTFEIDEINTTEYYYLGEFIISTEYRKSGLMKKLLSLHEKNAKELGYNKICLMTVVRGNHPLRPTDYVEIDVVCERFGYKKTEITKNLSWQTIQKIGEPIEMENKMALWIKEI